MSNLDECMHIASVELVQLLDNSFRTPNNGVDLLRMAQNTPESQFRAYITASRNIRMVNKFKRNA